MSDASDDIFDLAMREIAEMDHFCINYNKDDSELKEEIIELINDKDHYIENEFTELVRNIIKYDKFSEKQRRVLVRHLANDYIKEDDYL